MKKLTALILVLALAIGLTGCYGGELKLYNAFAKMQDITSVEADTEIGFTMETEGFSEDEQKILEQVISTLNDSKIKLHQKQTMNKDKTISKAIIDTNLKSKDNDMDMKIWLDMDASGDNLKLVEIFKLPQSLMNTAFPEEASKEYVVYDIASQLNAEDKEVDMKEIMEFSKEFQSKMGEFMKEFSKDFKPSKNMIVAKGDKLVNGQKLEMFELKLNDAELKELVKYIVNYSLDKEDGMQLVKDYLKAVMSVADVPEAEKAEMEKELKEGMEEFENQLPEVKAKFNEFMEKYKNVKVLGDKGIVIEYGINKEGYIAYENGSINLELNLEDIAKHMGKEDLEIKGIIRLGFNYNSKLYNINSDDVKIEMPKVDEKNSIDLFKMMELQMKAVEEEAKTVETVETETVETK